VCYAVPVDILHAAGVPFGHLGIGHSNLIRHLHFVIRISKPRFIIRLSSSEPGPLGTFLSVSVSPCLRGSTFSSVTRPAQNAFGSPNCPKSAVAYGRIFATP
jgi:hypothetical protein